MYYFIIIIGTYLNSQQLYDFIFFKTYFTRYIVSQMTNDQYHICFTYFKYLMNPNLLYEFVPFNLVIVRD